MDYLSIHSEQITSYLNIILNYITTYAYHIYQLSGPFIDTELDSWKMHSQNYFYIILMVVIVSSMNNFICLILGVLYPISYSLKNHATIVTNTTVVTNTTNTDDMAEIYSTVIKLNKYWIIYNLFMLIDNFFGFVLHLIPGYPYIKFFLIYFLIKDKFVMTNTAFNVVNHIYQYCNGGQPLHNTGQLLN
jgi:hypothetical protein